MRKITGIFSLVLSPAEAAVETGSLGPPLMHPIYVGVSKKQAAI